MYEFLTDRFAPLPVYEEREDFNPLFHTCKRTSDLNMTPSILGSAIHSLLEEKDDGKIYY